MDARPRIDDLTRPALELVARGIVDSRLLRKALLEQLKPAGGEAAITQQAVSWALISLSKAGLIARRAPRLYEATPDGRAALGDGPSKFDDSFLRRFTSYSDWVAASRSEGAEETPVVLHEALSVIPLDRARSAQEENNRLLAQQLLERLLDADFQFFERAVIDLLTAMGYGGGRDGAAQQLGRAGDGGVDGVINEDALGLDAVYIQAKRYAPDNVVGRPAIQQFVGSLQGEGATKGVFATTSSFSSEARQYVAKLSQRIVLIDGQRFARLMIEHGVGVQTTETIVLREVDENFFSED